MPEHQEKHTKNIFGRPAVFPAGSYNGSLEEVTENVTRFGDIAPCHFVKGSFDQTMVNFREPVAAAYIDVDLVEPPKTCIRCLYPLLIPGGVLFSQDGHLPLVIELLRNEQYWREVTKGDPLPRIEGLGKRKLVRIVKAPRTIDDLWAYSGGLKGTHVAF